MLRRFSKYYKIAVICSLLTGIFLNLYNTRPLKIILSYYTLQSNIVCLLTFICFTVLEIKNQNHKQLYYLIKGAVTIAILMATLVYYIKLVQVGFVMNPAKSNTKHLADMFVHFISPMLVLFDYFLFDEKGHFKIFYPVTWIILPSLYVLYVYTYSARGGVFFGIGGSRKYAYYFLDYEVIGYTGVLKYMIIIAVVILTMSYILTGLDKMLSKKDKGP